MLAAGRWPEAAAEGCFCVGGVAEVSGVVGGMCGVWGFMPGNGLRGSGEVGAVGKVEGEGLRWRADDRRGGVILCEKVGGWEVLLVLCLGHIMEAVGEILLLCRAQRGRDGVLCVRAGAR